MIVIFSGFSQDAQNQDVMNFIRSSFKEDGIVKKIDVFMLLDESLEQVGLKVLVTIEPDSVALCVIEKLNNTFYERKPIFLRQYFQRIARNDKRSSVFDKDFVGNERRGNERRRKLLPDYP